MDEHSAIQIHKVNYPAWLGPFLSTCASSLKSDDLLGDAGYHCLAPHSKDNPSAYWRLTFFPRANEVYGGEHDGQPLLPSFRFDILPVLRLLQRVDAVQWESNLGSYVKTPPSVVDVQGVYHGNLVHFSVLAYAPFNEERTFLVEPQSGRYWLKDSQRSQG